MTSRRTSARAPPFAAAQRTNVAGEVALRFSDVHKRYPGQPVLAGLDLEVSAGEFFGLVGLNGAGKTTTIKSLLDFCTPDVGTIEIFGCSARDTRARARLAYLPERFLPPYHHTGEQFLAYLARLNGNDPDRGAMRDMCASLDLDPRALSRPVRVYSKGMSQKLGLAGCLGSGKELLILDEPMTGLDPKARVLVKRHLRVLREKGHTVFFSTHMLFDVQELCDRMGVLHLGKLKFVGTPTQCCERFDTDNLEDAYLRCIAHDDAGVR